MIWPNEPSTGNPIAAWCRKLLAACKASEIKSGVGYNVKRTSGGTTLELDERNAQSVFVKCCLEDGTFVYLPVLIRGKAYTTNEGTVTAFVATDGNVPDGSIVLE